MKKLDIQNFAKSPMVPPLLMLLLLAVIPLVISGYYLHSIILILMYTVLGSAWNWLGGFAGQMSMAHAAFYGVGAYVCGCCQVWWEMNPWIATLISVVIVGLFSILVGLPVFRLKGHYFSIATIAIGEIIKTLFINWEAAGGAVGLYLPIRQNSFANFQFRSKVPYYYIIMLLAALAVGITYWLKNSKNGYYFRAIKENPDAAKALGINIVGSKLLAITLSGMFCALAGSFYVNYVLYIDPDGMFRFLTSVQIALIAVMGGMGTVWGPLIGSVIIIALSEGSRTFLGGMGAGLDLVIYGLLIMLIAVYQPGGIVGAVETWKRRRKQQHATAKSKAGRESKEVAE
ncbi:MAG: branched-chain amino acid ABC transporter permease [Candidatus Pelethousia sp.]|nr:branched-chain amino acid ABC transporter permease [Candidatus Pelethousia sp.]